MQVCLFAGLINDNWLLTLTNNCCTVSKKSHTRQMDLKGYKFCADPAMNFLDEGIIISLETTVSWIHGM